LHAIDVAAPGEMSDMHAVVKGDTLWGVELAPAPLLIAPLMNTPVRADQSVSFQWEQTTDALTYEF
jgi:hypothetical protein